MMRFVYDVRSQEDRNIADIADISSKYYKFETDPYALRAGALDLVSYIEIGSMYVAMAYGKNVLQGIWEGMTGDDFGKTVGRQFGQTLQMMFEYNVRYLKDLYQAVVARLTQEKEAVVISESFGRFQLYVVLNQSGMNERLLEKLPEAICSVVILAMNDKLPVDAYCALQLYPDYNDCSWRYLFTPTASGYGSHVDQYIDFKSGSVVLVRSAEEFQEIFQVDSEDECKLIISHIFHSRNKRG